MHAQVHDGRKDNHLTSFKKIFTVSMEAWHSNQATYNFRVSQESAFDAQKAG